MHFNRAWKTECPNIKIRKFSRFTKCSTCVGLKEKIKSTLNSVKRMKYSMNLKDHINFIKKQRLFYYSKRYQAKVNKNCLSIIIDGSDMQNYGIPYFYDITKDSSVGYKIPYKLYGAIVHGVSTHAYLVNKHWGGDSNIVVQILHELIHQLHYKNLKKTLYLQVIY